MLHTTTKELVLLVPPSIVLQTTEEQQHWECELWVKRSLWEHVWYVHTAGVTGGGGASLRAHMQILFLVFSKDWAIIWLLK